MIKAMIKATVEVDGFEGILFPVSEKKDKVVIVVSGSNGGMRLKEKSFSFPYKHIAFQNISHIMFTEISMIYKLAFKSERQNVTQCAKERKQLADELLNWISNVWN